MKTTFSTLVALLLFSTTTFAYTKASRKVSGTVSITSSDELVVGDNSSADVNANLPACSNGFTLTFVVLSNSNVVNINAASGDGFYNDPTYGTTLTLAGGGTAATLDCFDHQWYPH